MDHERLVMRSCGALFSARWKGQAIYYNLVTNTRLTPKAAWSNLKSCVAELGGPAARKTSAGWPRTSGRRRIP